MEGPPPAKYIPEKRPAEHPHWVKINPGTAPESPTPNKSIKMINKPFPTATESVFFL